MQRLSKVLIPCNIQYCLIFVAVLLIIPERINGYAKISVFQNLKRTEFPTNQCPLGIMLKKPLAFACVCVTGVWGFYKDYCTKPVSIVGGQDYCFKLKNDSVAQFIPMGNPASPFDPSLSILTPDFTKLLAWFGSGNTSTTISPTYSFITVTSMAWTLIDTSGDSLCLKATNKIAKRGGTTFDQNVFCLFNTLDQKRGRWTSIVQVRMGCWSKVILRADDCGEIRLANSNVADCNFEEMTKYEEGHKLKAGIPSDPRNDVDEQGDQSEDNDEDMDDIWSLETINEISTIPKTVSIPAPSKTVSIPIPSKTVPIPTPPKSVSIPTPPKSVSIPTPPKTVPIPTPQKTVPIPTPPKTVSIPTPSKAVEIPTSPKGIPSLNTFKSAQIPNLPKGLPISIPSKDAKIPTLPNTVSIPTLPNAPQIPNLPKDVPIPTLPKTVLVPIPAPPKTIPTFEEFIPDKGIPIPSPTSEPVPVVDKNPTLNYPCDKDHALTRDAVKKFWLSDENNQCSPSLNEAIFTDQLRRFTVKQFDHIFESRQKSLDQIELLLNLTTELMTATCSSVYVPRNFFTLAFQAFTTFVREDFFYGMVPPDPEVFPKIVTSLRGCLKRSRPQIFEHQDLKCEIKKITGVQILPEKKVPLKVPPEQFYTKYEILIETTWKMFVNAYSFCYKDFNPSDHHHFAVIIMELFTKSIWEKWTQPPSSQELYGFFLPNFDFITEIQNNIDYCVAATGSISSCPVWLDRTAPPPKKDSGQDPPRKKRDINDLREEKSGMANSELTESAFCFQDVNDQEDKFNMPMCSPLVR